MILRITVFSAFVLFLELTVIRWVSTEIGIFAYLQNAVLVACFLGLGAGALAAQRGVRLHQAAVPSLILVAILSEPHLTWAAQRIAYTLSVFHDFVVWDRLVGATGHLRWVAAAAGLIGTLLILGVIWKIFTPLGAELGKLLSAHPNRIRAYSANILGSILGGLLYSVLSYLCAPPTVWIVVSLLLGVPQILAHDPEKPLHELGVMRRRAVLFVAVLLALRGISLVQHDSIETVWSPYQKLALVEQPGEYGTKRVVLVNNNGFQEILDGRAPLLPSDPPGVVPFGMGQYDVPGLLFGGNPKKVLVVGAGTGNDVAGALRNGAEEVVAVEIDPAIAALGKKYHPEHPYDSPKVRLVINDARAFFAQSDERFDLVVFGLLDSHSSPALTTSRLDNFVYTEQAIAQAKRLLKPDGVLTLVFQVNHRFIGERHQATLTKVFGYPPLSFIVPASKWGFGGYTYVTGNLDRVKRALEANPEFARAVDHWQTGHQGFSADTAPTSDDWPYLYVQHPTIPTLFYIILAGVLLLGWYAFRSLRIVIPRGGEELSSFLHFFLLGSAFMLLETHNLLRGALAFGSTFTVNTIVITSILLMILAANILAERFPRTPVIVSYLCILVVGAYLYQIDYTALSGESFATRFAVCGLLAASPLFFSALVFARSWSAEERPYEALGANLLGALAGGLLQLLSFLLGLRALVILALICYAGSYIALRRLGTARDRRVGRAAITSAPVQSSVDEAGASSSV